ncbi:MAG: helix-turn-helix transcriptional regulator [Bacteroidota bacterium]
MKPLDLPHHQLRWIQRFNTVVEANLDQMGLKIQLIAEEMHVSERTLRTRVKRATGLTPAQYLQNARLARAKAYLERKHFETVAEVSFAVGIRNASHFSRAFKQKFEKSPSAYL